VPALDNSFPVHGMDLVASAQAERGPGAAIAPSEAASLPIVRDAPEADDDPDPEPSGGYDAHAPLTTSQLRRAGIRTTSIGEE
jgi:hypothetical protein